jgi:CheY-like chemotaxis protein
LAPPPAAGSLDVKPRKEPDVTMSQAVSRQPRVELLLADDDAPTRSLVAARAGDLGVPLVVLEAVDGAEALQIGLQQTPQLALLDVEMPRLGGIEVATTLRDLRPGIRLALHTADPSTHRDRARERGLQLFDKAELDRVFGWLAVQANALQQRRALRCSACGYGIVRARPPERCPMCQREDTWIHSRRRSSAVGQIHRDTV